MTLTPRATKGSQLTVAELDGAFNGLDAAIALKAPLASPTFTTSATFSFLTSGRVPYATTGGALTDSASFQFDGGTLNVSAQANISGRVGLGDTDLVANHDNVRVSYGGVQTPTTVGVAEYGHVNLVDVTGNPNQSIFGSMIRPFALRKAASGTHPYMANLYLTAPPTAPTGAGAVGNTAMLLIDSVMAEAGASNWSIWSQSGVNRFDGGIQGNPSDGFQLKVISSNLVPGVDGNANLGSASLRWSATYTNTLSVSSTTASTSTTTGALVVSGGLGVGGNIWAGGYVLAPQLYSNGLAASYRLISYLTNGTARWETAADATAESGSNAGSNWYIKACTDAGATIDFPITITRAANGTITLGRPVTVTGNLSATATGDHIFGASAGAAQTTMVLRSASGQNRMVQFFTGSNARWAVFCDGAAESGSNAGSDFQIRAFTDAGATIDNPIVINRVANGTITMSRPVKLPVYAFASLPTGSAGMRAFVNNNSAAPAWGSAANGSGSTTVPVFHDGTSWKVG